MGDIGKEQKEIEFEPLPDSVPQQEPAAPSVPTPASVPDKEEVPA